MPKTSRPSGKKRALKEQKRKEAEARQAAYIPEQSEANRQAYQAMRKADFHWQRLVMGNI